jgi:hypothetical protein
VNESDWNNCTDPGPMLELLRGGASDRKLRLFACACVRRVWPVLPPGPTHEAVRHSEDYADRKATARDLGRIRKPGRIPVLHPSNGVALSLAPLLRPDVSCQDASVIAEAVTRFVGWECRGGRPVEYVIHQEVVQAEGRAQATLLSDIIGSPFRPVALDPTSQTHEVLVLAHAIYEERTLPSGHLDAARLAVLADVVEEAGATDAQLLSHLRSPGPHVRGCFAVDAVLGRR